MPTQIIEKESQPTIDPYTEYVVGGLLGNSLYNQIGTSLGIYSDDIVCKFGFSAYEEMMQDPKVSKCINLLKIVTLSDGLEISPSVSETHPDYEESRKISEFCKLSFENLDRSIKDILFEVLDAFVYGHKISEVTYEVKSILDDTKLYVVPKTIKPKPNKNVSFVVDRYLNILGFAATTGDMGFKGSLGKISLVKNNNNATTIVVNDVETDFVERDKFMVLTLLSKDGDPRGKSMLRPAFSPWYFKKQIYPEYLRFLLTCSMPLLVGFTPTIEGEVPILKNSDGTPVLDSSGKVIPVNREAALRDALVQARNATAIALRGGSELQEIGGKGSGLAFYKAVEILDAQIEGAILLQTLAVSEGRYQTRAASQIHMSVLDQLIYWVKDLLIQMLKNDLLTKLIKINFGDSYLKYMPKLSLGDTERRNFTDDANAIGLLFKAGFLTQSQLRYLDNMLGLPPRESGSLPVSYPEPIDSN